MVVKPCEQCGQMFAKSSSCGAPEWSKRRFCSPACKAASQRGKPTWNAGMAFPSNAQKIPCRICGEPTRYSGAPQSKLAGQVHCGKPNCAEQSRAIKNQRIAERATDDYAAERRPRFRNAWTNVKRISDEEALIAPWLVAQGWIPQFRLNTGVHTNRLPRQFVLDFALPAHNLYIEIDGTVHRLRRERDARRDAMLSERGWRGLRIPSSEVRSDIAAVQEKITTWLLKFAA